MMFFLFVFLLSLNVIFPASAQNLSLPEVKISDFHAPLVQEVVSPSGIKAWLIEEKNTPVIAVSVLFKGGIASDPLRLRGLSELTASLLDEGAGNMNAEEFQKTLAEKGIFLSFDASVDTFSVSMQTLKQNKSDAFRLLKLSLTKPRFDRKAVRRVKNQFYAHLDIQKGKPAFLVKERWNKLVFKKHPYAFTTPSKKGLNAVSGANLRRYVKERFARDNMIIGVSGNITADELSDLLEKTFSDLPKNAVLKTVEKITPSFSGRTDVLSMDIPQSAVIFGHNGLSRNHPDFYAGLLVNHIFGAGSFNSRLFKEIREKRGLTYGVSTHLSPLKASPLLTGGTTSDNSKMRQTIQIIQDEWKKMHDAGPDEAELTAAKKYITGSFPLTFTSGESMASFLAGLQYYQLGIDYFQHRNDLINTVTIEKAKEVAEKLFQPDNLFFVVIGKPANL